jgi:hypothetical protein
LAPRAVSIRTFVVQPTSKEDNPTIVFFHPIGSTPMIDTSNIPRSKSIHFVFALLALFPSSLAIAQSKPALPAEQQQTSQPPAQKSQTKTNTDEAPGVLAQLNSDGDSATGRKRAVIS